MTADSQVNRSRCRKWKQASDPFILTDRSASTAGARTEVRAIGFPAGTRGL